MTLNYLIDENVDPVYTIQLRRLKPDLFVMAEVGWVEKRNPTLENSVDVGVHFVQPNLRVYFRKNA